MYRFGHQQAGGVVDPSSQTEDIGDNAMKASDYGVKNLKRIMKSLEEWTTKEGETYNDMATMYGQILSQFNRYVGHVSSNVGGVYEYYKAAGQEGAVYTHVDKAHQRNAVKWLNKQLFDTPDWMLDQRVFELAGFSGHIERISGLQTRGLNAVLNTGRLARMIENETLHGTKAYTVTTLFYDLRRGIWSEIYSGKKIDTYRRNLQRAHINRLNFLLNEARSQRGANRGYFKRSTVNIDQSDIKAMARGELNRLKRDIKANMSKAGNQTARYHLQDALARIDKALDPK